MRRKVWINKLNSFRKAEDFEVLYYLSMTPEERLTDVQLCREEYLKIKKGVILNEGGKRLRRVIRLIKQK
jgi:hypothetical protein